MDGRGIRNKVYHGLLLKKTNCFIHLFHGSNLLNISNKTKCCNYKGDPSAVLHEVLRFFVEQGNKQV